MNNMQIMSFFIANKTTSDRVVVDTSDYGKITKWNKEKHGSETYNNYKKLYFPLSTFLLRLLPKKNYDLECIVVLKDHNIFDGELYGCNWYIRYCRKPEQQGIDFDGVGVNRYEIEQITAMVLGILMYICAQAEQRVIEYREKPSANPTNHTNHTAGSRTESTCYLLKNIIEYATHRKIEHSNYTRKCDCWGVRGHYRHYKNGKVIFIKAHEKGAKRGENKPMPKEYRLGGNL